MLGSSRAIYGPTEANGYLIGLHARPERCTRTLSVVEHLIDKFIKKLKTYSFFVPEPLETSNRHLRMTYLQIDMLLRAFLNLTRLSGDPRAEELKK